MDGVFLFAIKLVKPVNIVFLKPKIQLLAFEQCCFCVWSGEPKSQRNA